MVSQPNQVTEPWVLEKELISKTEQNSNNKQIRWGPKEGSVGKGIAKSNNLNLIPRTYMMEERTEPDKLPFDSPPSHTLTHT